jgi:hypothetical protein
VLEVEEFNDGWILPGAANGHTNNDDDGDAATTPKRRAVDDKDGQQSSNPDDTTSSSRVRTYSTLCFISTMYSSYYCD